MTALVYGGAFGQIPPYASDIEGAKEAGVPWHIFAAWPLYPKNMIFAHMTAKNQAQKKLQEQA